MFPTRSTGSARRWPPDPRSWVGVVSYHYPDASVTEELVAADPTSPLPARFATEAAATQAAEAWGQAYRLSDRTEVLTGLYGGES
ncbi:MAG: hypothetical protein HGB30_12675 [Holophagaceae bacterium]|nr:hypothetical protein [Holophagaceae bacterium]